MRLSLTLCLLDCLRIHCRTLQALADRTFCSCTPRQVVRCRYAVGHGHDPEDLGWLFKSRTTPGVYSAATGGAWQTIAQALPDRTTQQVWACGTRILHPNNYKVCALPGSSSPFLSGHTFQGTICWLGVGVGVRHPHPAPQQLQGVQQSHRLSPRFLYLRHRSRSQHGMRIDVTFNISPQSKLLLLFPALRVDDSSTCLHDAEPVEGGGGRAAA